eukprot:364046-Chlamydomonas_euryale.AAC.3
MYRNTFWVLERSASVQSRHRHACPICQLGSCGGCADRNLWQGKTKAATTVPLHYTTPGWPGVSALKHCKKTQRRVALPMQ